MSTLIGALALVDVTIVIALLVAGVPGAISLLFLVAVLPAAVIWLVLPRSFEVWGDRLVIVFPVLFRWTLPFETVATAREAKWWHAYAFMGVRLASNPGMSVDILRVEPSAMRRPNLVITPEDRDEFIARLNAAVAQHRSR
jgi:hypothetical protein